MKKLINFVYLVAQNFILFMISLFVKRDEHIVAIGSWSGDRYVDNSRYLAEYISENCEEIKIFWIGKCSIKSEVLQNLKNAEFYQINKFRTNVALLKCKYMFFSQLHTTDISRCNVYRNAVLCYLHHGMPIKKWGQDGLHQKIQNLNAIKKIYYRIVGTYKNYDYFITSSHFHDITNCTALSMHGCTLEKNLHTGTPRNDMYFGVTAEKIISMKALYAEALGFSVNKTIIMYLPTYRRIANTIFSFSALTDTQLERIQNLLSKYNAIIIEKSHVAEKHKTAAHSKGNIFFADSKMNVQEMMLFCDYLISDYSGALLDFSLLNRPIIHFAYDYDYYKNTDSGLYYDISDFSAGPVVETYDDLLNEIENCLSGIDLYEDRRKQIRQEYMEYEIGTASEQIVNIIMKD